MANDADDIIYKLFDTILQIFQEATETSNERGSEFIHESVASLYYHFQKTDMKTGYSYMKSFKRLRSKGATLNPWNKKDNKCFQCAPTLALNHQNIG